MLELPPPTQVPNLGDVLSKILSLHQQFLQNAGLNLQNTGLNLQNQSAANILKTQPQLNQAKLDLAQGQAAAEDFANKNPLLSSANPVSQLLGLKKYLNDNMAPVSTSVPYAPGMAPSSAPVAASTPAATPTTSGIPTNNIFTVNAQLQTPNIFSAMGNLFGNSQSPTATPNLAKSLASFQAGLAAPSAIPSSDSPGLGSTSDSDSETDTSGSSDPSITAASSSPTNSQSGTPTSTSNQLLPSGVDLDSLIKNKIIQQSQGPILPGAAGVVQGLEMTKAKYGPNSPQYQMALQIQNAKTSSLDNRSLPTLVKLQNAYDAAVQSGDTVKAAQLTGAMQKEVTTAGNIDRATMATALLQTLNSIPVNAISRYAGPAGQTNLSYDKMLNATNNSPAAYDAYIAFNQSTLPLIKNQITKLYNGSVSPGAQKDLDILGNQATWASNPNAVKIAYKNLIDIVNTEAKSFIDVTNKGVAPFEPAHINGLDSPKSVTMAEVNDYAQRKNMTTQDVIKALNAKGVSING